MHALANGLNIQPDRKSDARPSRHDRIHHSTLSLASELGYPVDSDYNPLSTVNQGAVHGRRRTQNHC